MILIFLLSFAVFFTCFIFVIFLILIQVWLFELAKNLLKLFMTSTNIRVCVCICVHVLYLFLDGYFLRFFIYFIFFVRSEATVRMVCNLWLANCITPPQHQDTYTHTSILKQQGVVLIVFFSIFFSVIFI